jgi:predicted NAD-dependent protein-ADP-ribosyltransferase YbiA (DUF1768 family)
MVEQTDKYIQFYSRSADINSRYLSNFTEIPMGLTIPKNFHVGDMEGITFPTVEHAFQASKLIFSCVAVTSLDITELRELRENKLTPQQAKARGGRKHFNAIGVTLDIEKWNSVAIDVMRDLIAARYATDEPFKNILLTAKKKQIKFKHYEFSGAKSIWGGFFKGETWLGQNQLGKIMDECQYHSRVGDFRE